MPRGFAAVLIACALCATAGCGGSKSPQPKTTTSAPRSTQAPAATAPSPTTGSSKPSLLHPAALKATAPVTYSVVFKTTKGPFTVKVHRNLAPIGADRFYNLVQNKYYDGVRFFRVVPDFVVQFGIHPRPEIAKAWQTANIADDPVSGSNKRGTITFATAGPNTRTTQVFINLGDNSRLDAQGFAPFGSVIAGMEDTIRKLYSGYGELPPQAQQQMTEQGDAFLQTNFPKLDRILTARISK